MDWIAIVYLLLVIGGYSAYAFLQEITQTVHMKMHPMEDMRKKGMGNMKSDHDSHDDSDVKAAVELEEDKLTVTLTDQSGNAMDDLKVNHEKLMHLIVISEDLEKFQHLHPEKSSLECLKRKRTLKIVCMQRLSI